MFPGSAKIHLKFHMQVLTHLFTYDWLTNHFPLSRSQSNKHTLALLLSRRRVKSQEKLILDSLLYAVTCAVICIYLLYHLKPMLDEVYAVDIQIQLF